MDEILRLIEQKELAKAIVGMEAFVYSHPELHAIERIVDIRKDYELMTDYWRKGFKDPQREQVYGQLLHRLLMMVVDMTTKERIGRSPLLKNMYDRVNSGRHDWSIDGIRSRLEGFVSEAAIIQLEPEHVRQPKEKQLQEDHRQMSEDLFDYVLTSGSWNESVAQAFADLLISPTIDSTDQQLIVSALTLSVMNAFDANKFRLLAKVYQTATEEHVRQRALVGWGLCLGTQSEVTALFPEVRQVVEVMAKSQQCREELTELQLQLMYCMDAESDTRRIHDEIMPELMKNNNFRITRNGIEEVEDNPMEDILNPESSERKMEKLEESMQKMIDMQRSGADIYFGGFAQMKRHPFFSKISNWLMPFTPQHPAVSQIWNGTQGRRFLHKILATGSFCESDKYSFVLAFEKVVGMLPQKLMEMLENGEATLMGGEVEPEERRRPAYIRRIYLQDLYRFFNLCPSRSLFRTPFGKEQGDERHRLLFASKLLKHTEFESCMGEVAAFLLKRRQYDDAALILSNYSEEFYDYQFYLMCGTVLIHSVSGRKGLDHPALYYFQKAVELKPDSERALTGYARAAFFEHDYQGALDAYDRLLLMHEGHKNFLLNKAVCLANLHRYEEAQKILYQLDYEHPDDDNIHRVLAWILVCSGKQEQAGKIYGKLLERGKPAEDDVLNEGLRLWIIGDVTAAQERFRQLAMLRNGHFDAKHEFDVEAADLLRRNGISEVEIQLMKEELARYSQG